MPAQTSPEQSELLITEEVAARLRVSRRYVHNMARAGRLPYIRLVAHGQFRFRVEDVERLLESRRGDR